MTNFAMTASAEAAVKKAIRRHDSAEVVLGQSVDWVPERWLDDFPSHEAQLRRVASASVSTEIHGRVAISRRAVFALQDDPVVGFLAAMAWGFGPRGRRWQARRALGYGVGQGRRPRIQVAVAHRRLRDAQALVRRNAGEAFEQFCLGSGTLHLPGLGPSFGTKFLYFTGYKSALAPGQPPPLILDQLVAASLGLVATNSRATYERYLVTAQRLAGIARPDVVEHALFEQGRAQRAGDV